MGGLVEECREQCRVQEPRRRQPCHRTHSSKRSSAGSASNLPRAWSHQRVHVLPLPYRDDPEGERRIRRETRGRSQGEEIHEKAACEEEVEGRGVGECGSVRTVHPSVCKLHVSNK